MPHWINDILNWTNEVGKRWGGVFTILGFVWFMWWVVTWLPRVWDFLLRWIVPVKTKFVANRIKRLRSQITTLEAFGERERDETISKLLTYARRAVISFAFVMLEALLVIVMFGIFTFSILERDVLHLAIDVKPPSHTLGLGVVLALPAIPIVIWMDLLRDATEDLSPSARAKRLDSLRKTLRSLEGRSPNSGSDEA